MRRPSSSSSTTTTATTLSRNPNPPLCLRPFSTNRAALPEPFSLETKPPMTMTLKRKPGGSLETAAFLRWGMEDIFGAAKIHPVPCAFAVSLVFFMGVEYTLRMVPSTSPPFDLGFIATRSLNRLLAARPGLNTLLAGLNTVFVAMQSSYIVWTFVVEGRLRPGLAALFMFTCRGILGYTTQLPLPQLTVTICISFDFLGSGADFPVGNVSFFLFFSGHVAGSVIASLDMRRMQRKELAWTFDVLNFLQVVRLLVTRGHYTIDLAVGVGAGILFDFFAGNYVESKKNVSGVQDEGKTDANKNSW